MGRRGKSRRRRQKERKKKSKQAKVESGEESGAESVAVVLVGSSERPRSRKRSVRDIDSKVLHPRCPAQEIHLKPHPPYWLRGSRGRKSNRNRKNVESQML